LKSNPFRFAPLALGFALVTSEAFADASAATLAATECRADLMTVESQGRGATFDDTAVKEELSKADCERDDVYCVDATGYPVPGESRDPGLKPGQALTIKLFGPTRCVNVLNVGTDVKQSNVSLFPQEAAAQRALPRDATVPPPEIQLLAKATVTPSATTDAVTVVVSRTDVPLSLEGITLTVTPGLYYLDVGLLAAFAPNFERVSTSRAPGSEEQFIREERSIRPAAAIALSYFPFGQYSVPRFTGYHGLGFQIGIGGDLARIGDEFYMGLAWEPVPGAGISSGLALLTMQRLQPGYPSGTLVNPNDVPKDEFLGPRFYFGFSLNTQVFQTVLQLGEKARVPN